MIDPFLIKKTSKQYDAIVVGSGITGGWAAKELSEKGLSVLLVERGRPVKHKVDYTSEGKAPWDMSHRGKVDLRTADEEYDVQKRCYAFADATKQFFTNDKDSPYATTNGTDFAWIRGYHLGGRSLLWARQTFRWGAQDFEENLMDGHGTDWPIRYPDLAPWYSHVEKFVGISGSIENIPEAPDGEFLPPFEFNEVERFAKQQIESKYPKRHVIQGRCAHLSEPTQFFLDQGRTKCMARNQCQRGCSFGAYFSTLSSTLPAALKTNNLEIACHSIVHSLIYDDKSNRVTGVNIIDEETMETREYYGKMIFMCASTIGTTQIMLNSVSDAFPTGIGNSSGVLGHYLMDHIYNASASGKVAGFENDYYKGTRPTSPHIPRFANLKKQTENFSRGFWLKGKAKRKTPNKKIDPMLFGHDLKQSLQRPAPWRFSWGGSGEMQPNFDNHIALHPTKTDKWGIPQVLIDCKWSKNDYLMMEGMADACVEMLEAMGATSILRTITDDPPGLSIHEMGTARMGRDPKTSVLNGYNQSHDIPNLFVTDGACMSSSSHQNPSLTYMALTARAANYAAEKLKRNEL